MVNFLNGIVNKVETFAKRDFLLSKPTKIFLELTNSCNLKCKMCPRGSDSVKNPGFMSKGVFEKVIPYLKTTNYVCLSGFGESLLHPEFLNILKIIKSNGCKTQIYTNGLLLTKEMADAIVDLGLDYVNFSIDGATPETYEDIRVGGRFNRLEQSLKYISEAKCSRKTDQPYLTINFMAMKRNIAELPEVIRLAKKYNFQGVSAQNLAIYSKDLENQSYFKNKEYFDRYISEAKEKAKELGIKLTLTYFKEEVRGCCVPFNTTYIACDGAVFACWFLAHKIGDLKESNLSDIWNGVRAKEMRKQFRKNKLNENCARCYDRAPSEENLLHYPQQLMDTKKEGRLRYNK